MGCSAYVVVPYCVKLQQRYKKRHGRLVKHISRNSFRVIFVRDAPFLKALVTYRPKAADQYLGRLLQLISAPIPWVSESFFDDSNSTMHCPPMSSQSKRPKKALQKRAA
jgi:hypothetical protein